MQRRGFLLLWLLAISSPVFALSVVAQAALAPLFNFQTVGALVMAAVIALWVPDIIRKKVLVLRSSREEAKREAAKPHKIYYSPDPVVTLVSDERFMREARNAGWSSLNDGVVIDEHGVSKTQYSDVTDVYDHDLRSSVRLLESEPEFASDIKYRSDFSTDDEYRDWFAAQKAANDASIHPDYFNGQWPYPFHWYKRRAELRDLADTWNLQSVLSEADEYDFDQYSEAVEYDFDQYSEADEYDFDQYDWGIDGRLL
jgi:hypothetical protein